MGSSGAGTGFGSNNNAGGGVFISTASSATTNITAQVFINDENSAPSTFVDLADVPPNRTISRILEDVQADYQRTESRAGRSPQQIVDSRLTIVYEDPVTKNQREYEFRLSSVHDTAISDIKVPIGDDKEMRPLPNPNRKLTFKCVFMTAAHHANTTGFGSGFGSAGNTFNRGGGGGGGWGASGTSNHNNNNNTGSGWGASNNNVGGGGPGGGWGSSHSNNSTNNTGSGGWGAAAASNNQPTRSAFSSGFGNNTVPSTGGASGWGSSNTSNNSNNNNTGGGWGTSASAPSNNNNNKAAYGWGSSTSDHRR